jgi:hypothetical protein
MLPEQLKHFISFTFVVKTHFEMIYLGTAGTSTSTFRHVSSQGQRSIAVRAISSHTVLACSSSSIYLKEYAKKRWRMC